MFSERFLNTNFKVAELSRFKSNKEVTNNIEKFNEGKIHILVGTHKILSSKLDFNDVGLMIIDEEHRFGVNQKEKIKKIKASINILTLTATPIPRTLSISLDGLRDLSVIKTPPKKRYWQNTENLAKKRDFAQSWRKPIGAERERERDIYISIYMFSE